MLEGLGVINIELLKLSDETLISICTPVWAPSTNIINLYIKSNMAVLRGEDQSSGGGNILYNMISEATYLV